MPQIIARIPVSISLEIPDSVETPVGRLVQTHGLLKNGLLGTKLDAVTPAGQSLLEIASLDEARLAVTWENDPIDGDTQTWTTLGQRIDDREYKIEPTEDLDSSTVALSLRSGERDWTVAAIVAHPALAEAIGKAWCAGDLAISPDIDLA